jgi:DNA-binding NtrC family response regulator
LQNSAHTEAAYFGHGEHILVADDEDLVRQIVQGILEKAGYRVTVARDGEEATVKFSRDPQSFQLAILDMQMPIKDGLVTARELRAQRPDLPIIGASGFATTAMAARVSEMSLSEFLEKPFTVTALLRAVRQALGRSGATVPSVERM